MKIILFVDVLYRSISHFLLRNTHTFSVGFQLKMCVVIVVQDSVECTVVAVHRTGVAHQVMSPCTPEHSRSSGLTIQM